MSERSLSSGAAKSEPRPTLTITGVDAAGGEARLLEIARSDGAPLGFVGGQYLIIDTGVVLEGGKRVKRAYSLLSSDAEQRRAEIAVKRIPGGPGSGVLHEIGPGAALSFSGPWGKLSPGGEFRGRVLVVATDTAITAGLGLVGSTAAAAWGTPPDLLWLVETPTYFVSDTFVRRRLPERCRYDVITDAPPVGHRDRAALACARIEAELEGRSYDLVLCAGDGAVIYPLRDRLESLGVPRDRVSLESFFNNPMKSAAVSKASA